MMWLYQLVLAAACGCVAFAAPDQGARYFHTPMHEISQTQLYLTMNEHQEVVVSYAGKGVDLRPKDFITHADGIRILTGWPNGVDDFLESGEKEVVVPIVDEDDEMYGGQRLKGFMLLSAIQPRKLSSRRGDVVFDLEEGGPAPTMKLGNIVIGAGGAKSTSDPSYVPPPNGGGACISTRDCFPHASGGQSSGGLCKEGVCSCLGDYTGSYCQLHRPEHTAVAAIVKKAAAAAGPQLNVNVQKKEEKEKEIVPPAPPVPPATPVAPQKEATPVKPATVTTPIKLSFEAKKTVELEPAAAVPVEAAARASAPVSQPSFAAVPSAQLSAGNTCSPSTGPTPVPPPVDTTVADREREELQRRQQQEQQQQQQSGQEGEEVGSVPKPRLKKRRPKPGAGGNSEDSSTGNGGGPRRVVDGAGTVMDQQKEKSLTMDDLYGEGKAYPEPYNAGKLPNNLVHERYRKRYNRESFLYSVRFRVGPFGITFDNKMNNGTFVQNLVRGEQAEQSDIKEGDQLIAVDSFNVSDVPAKVTQRMMGGLSWPRVLVFQTKVSGADPREKELQVRRRTFNMTIVYPPTLVGEYQFLLSEWAPALAPQLTTPFHPLLRDHPAFAAGASPAPAFCPVYRIRAPNDAFGCAVADDESMQLPWEVDQIVEHKGLVEQDVESGSQLLAMLMQEAASREIFVEPRSLAIAKRGVCTFVQKAMKMQNAGANLALIVNNVNEMTDMPAGKEKTDQLYMPVGLSTDNDALLTHLAASNHNEIWAIVSESGIPAAAPAVVAAPVTPAPATPVGKIGKGGKNTRAAANAAKSKLTPVTPAAPAVAAEIVFESGGMSVACGRVQSLVEDIIDRFPHSVPPLSSRQILTSIPPDTSKTRGLTEEGGRLALSGQNGWAFFDYHLAMFGPQEVPLGPFRLQMAMPPFGCDPGAYTVRIQGAVVAILRGGGCSFGIKVINAQKLGAKAVIIVNTDDMKTMRLMALPDEVPLIQIPCIMVSRRIQFYLEEQLRPYFPIDQHMVSIQPTGLFGEYEKRNQLTLPERLKNH